uniref:Uncharacterized protein n=1 Tax=Lepeophtheirus salmonis TaxID=72036 RepID=A0A0K2TH60_LEPSM
MIKIEQGNAHQPKDRLKTYTKMIIYTNHQTLLKVKKNMQKIQGEC